MPSQTLWQRTKKPLFFALFIFAALVIGSLLKKKEAVETVKLSGQTMGTLYNITYSDSHNLSIQPQIDSLLLVVNMSMSTYIDTSIISQINQTKDTTEGIRVDEHFMKVFTKSKEIYDITDGAFDPTVMPLVNAWGFGFSNIEQVDSNMIDSLLALVNFDNFHLTGKIVSKRHPDAMLDFSAIAKGYGVDVLGEYLEIRGINNYMVEIGGEVRCRGKNQHNKWWRIGVDKPVEQRIPENDRELQVVVELQNKSLATSGNYRNFYVKDSVKYAHTINPVTGYPEFNEMLSVSIFADDCMTADAYATACMVMGPDKAKELIANQPALECYFIYRAESDSIKVYYTEKISRSIVEPRE